MSSSKSKSNLMEININSYLKTLISAAYQDIANDWSILNDVPAQPVPQFTISVDLRQALAEIMTRYCSELRKFANEEDLNENNIIDKVMETSDDDYEPIAESFQMLIEILLPKIGKILQNTNDPTQWFTCHVVSIFVSINSTSKTVLTVKTIIDNFLKCVAVVFAEYIYYSKKTIICAGIFATIASYINIDKLLIGIIAKFIKVKKPASKTAAKPAAAKTAAKPAAKRGSANVEKPKEIVKNKSKGKSPVIEKSNPSKSDVKTQSSKKDKNGSSVASSSKPKPPQFDDDEDNEDNADDEDNVDDEDDDNVDDENLDDENIDDDLDNELSCFEEND